MHVTRLASLHLDLHGGVRDVETVLELTDDLSHDLLALPNALLGDDDVAAAGDDARADHPHVQIVDVEHARAPP